MHAAAVFNKQDWKTWTNNSDYKNFTTAANCTQILERSNLGSLPLCCDNFQIQQTAMYWYTGTRGD